MDVTDLRDCRVKSDAGVWIEAKLTFARGVKDMRVYVQSEHDRCCGQSRECGCALLFPKRISFFVLPY